MKTKKEIMTHLLKMASEICSDNIETEDPAVAVRYMAYSAAAISALGWVLEEDSE